ncbi:MAG: biotin--[acetyl-CoA-carboxylase] ligase [Synechococcales bacterium]|nr:biotin--[acetyl-CoA-carboxylase] ligase [Synechococcales bacterium]
MGLNPDRLVAAYDHLATLPQQPVLPVALQPPQIFPILDSTNRHLWDLWKTQDLPEGTAIVAEQQSAGKGQRGRQWRSPLGGLYLSIALKPNLPVQDAALLTLCSSWGIANALRHCPDRDDPDHHYLDRNCPDQTLSPVKKGAVQPEPKVKIPVQVKWLNDLILEGGKLGGILTETRVRGDRIYQAIVGIGINWSNPVSDPGIALQPFLPEDSSLWLDSLETLIALVHWGAIVGYDQWQRFGTVAMLPQYLDLLPHLGKIIFWDGQPGEIVGVTEQGNLRVRLRSHSPAQSNPQGADRSGQEIFLPPGSIRLGYPGQLNCRSAD